MSMFAALGDAVEGLEISTDGDAVAEVLGLVDRLNAKVTEAIGRFDHDGLWELEGFTSMTAWMKYRGRMSGGAAAAMVRTARRLRDLPVTTGAWGDGGLSS